MKTLILTLTGITISFFGSLFQGTTRNSNMQSVNDIRAYKLRNAVTCGPGLAGLYTGYSFSYFSYQANWNFSPAKENAYNTLWIPDTLCGTDFTMRMHDTTKQYLNGFLTNTAAFNNNDILGPTLIFRKGSTVQMHVTNNLPDTTTVHWHGMHLPAIMDGGPHQVIAPGQTWEPTWVVKNEAATYWYHPHLHMKTSQQLVQGLTGMIIVRDDKESALALPRTYGVDDIPLILSEKRFDAITKQFVMSRYGDTMMCNGTLHAQYNVPAQTIRFRLLNAAPERCYNIGMSNNMNFYVIASDAGLLDKPVAVTRYIMAPGERIEILVNLSALQGKSVAVRAFNASLPAGIAGSEADSASTPSILRSKLGKRDFDILRLNIITATAAGITTIPSTLVTNDTIDTTLASVRRKITISQAGAACSDPVVKCAWFNNRFFDMQRMDYKVKQDAVEIWEISNNGIVAHPFHIHDVSFKIISKSDGPIPEAEKGWKDVILLKKGTTVKFIAKFSDYADSLHPYMYHCHMTFHEDEGLMGQFVVMPSSSSKPLLRIMDNKLTGSNVATQQLNFTVTLTSPATQPVIVYYTTQDGSARSTADYTAVTGKLIFNPGETIKNIPVVITKNNQERTAKSVKIVLSKPVNAGIAKATATGIFVNDTRDTSQQRNSMNAAIKIFPSPVTNGSMQVTLDKNYPNNLKLLVYDTTGNLAKVHLTAANTTIVNVDVSSLAMGTYFLAAVDGIRESFSKKLRYCVKQSVDLQNAYGSLRLYPCVVVFIIR